MNRLLISKIPRTLCVDARTCDGAVGDAGDELFGGYNRYFWGHNLGQPAWLPYPLRHAWRSPKAIPVLRMLRPPINTLPPKPDERHIKRTNWQSSSGVRSDDPA